MFLGQLELGCSFEDVEILSIVLLKDKAKQQVRLLLNSRYST